MWEETTTDHAQCSYLLLQPREASYPEDLTPPTHVVIQAADPVTHLKVGLFHLDLLCRARAPGAELSGQPVRGNSRDHLEKE